MNVDGGGPASQARRTLDDLNRERALLEQQIADATREHAQEERLRPVRDRLASLTEALAPLTAIIDRRKAEVASGVETTELAWEEFYDAINSVKAGLVSFAEMVVEDIIQKDEDIGELQVTAIDTAENLAGKADKPPSPFEMPAPGDSTGERPASAAALASRAAGELSPELNTFLRAAKVDLPKFSGKGKELNVRSWLASIDEVFALYGCTDACTKTRLASVCLLEPARSSWRSFASSLSEESRLSYDQFTKHLLMAYGGEDPERNAMGSLVKVEQGSSTVQEYYLRFQQYLAELGEQGKLPGRWETFLFYSGLKQSLQEKLAVNPATLDKFTELQDLYKAALQHSKVTGRGNTNTTGVAAVVKGSKRPAPGPGAATSSEANKAARTSGAPVQNRGDLQAKALRFRVFTYTQANHLCLKCGQPGHVKAECNNDQLDWSKSKELREWSKNNKYASAAATENVNALKADAVAFLKATDDLAESFGLPRSEQFEPLSSAELGVMHSRHMAQHEVQQIAKQLSCSFTLDSFSVGGEGAVTDAWCPPAWCSDASKSFCHRELSADEVVWLHPPAGHEASYLQHYLAQKTVHPSISAAVILPASFHDPALSGMELVREYSLGTPVLRGRASDGSKVWIGTHPSCLPAPLQVWYDKPFNPGTLPAPVHSISAMAQGSKVFWVAGTIAGHRSDRILLDSGASCSFLSAAVASQLGLRTSPADHLVKLPDGTVTRAKGRVRVALKLSGCHTYADCLVVDLDGMELVLGMSWLSEQHAVLDFGARVCTLHTVKGVQHQLKLATPSVRSHVRRVISAMQAKRAVRKGCEAFLVHVRVNESPATLNGMHDSVADADDDTVAGVLHGDKPMKIDDRGVMDVLSEFLDVFPERLPSGLPPERDVYHTIPLVEGARASFKRPYRLSPAELKEVELAIRDLLERGHIQPSTSPFSAPIFFVKKKDGSLRMVVDYRALNKMTVKNRFPLPRIDDLLDKLQGAKYFSSLDLMSGYHQIPIQELDVPKTGFSTPFGHYEFKVLPFGLSNAPGTFQSVINSIFRQHGFVLAYMDDIMVFSKTREQHLQHLRTVCAVLRQHRLYAKLSKCSFMQRSVPFLGHVVGEFGVQASPTKLAAVRDWPVPTNVQELRAFLGFANYLRKFIQGYANVVAPLTALLKGGVAFLWSQECQRAFLQVKHAITSAPVLAMPDPNEPYEVVCDASGYGLGAVLLQHGKPVAFESCRMTPAERNYGAGEQELLATIHALRVWRCYLEGAPHQFTLVTDHAPNTFLQSKEILSRRQARWSEFLERFNYKWQYRPGRSNVADPLSRVTTLLGVLQLRDQATGWSSQAGGLSDSGIAAGLAAFESASPNPCCRPSSGETDANDGDLVQLHSAIAAELPAESCESQIQQGYASDPWFASEKNTQHLHLVGEYWFTDNGCIVVPDSPGLRSALLHELHDSCYSGHLGIGKTLHAVNRLLWWPTVKADVVRHVKECAVCQRDKGVMRKPAGLLQPLSIPDKRWGSVSMDFITQLPRTKRGHDAIFVVVDRLTKMVHIAPTQTDVNAEGTAKLYVDNVFKHHGLPLDIVSDRDSRFTGKFARAVCGLVGTRQSMSTAFHPQSDGQTERVNCILEDMLRHYVSATQDDWDDCLAMAEFAMNNAWQVSVQNTPFMLNYGKHPHMPASLPAVSTVPKALKFTQSQQFMLKKAKACLEAAQQRHRHYADQHRRDVQFKVHQKVMLSTKNLNLAGKSPGSKKLLPLWIGPFEVVELVGKAACKLKLPASLKVHDVFHVSLLKDFHGEAATPPMPLIVEGQEEFEVESVLAHRLRKVGKGKGSKARMEYLVEWKGYGPEDHSWEPEKNLSNSADAIQEYWDAVKLRELSQSADARASRLSNDPAPGVSPRTRKSSEHPKQSRKRRRARS